MPSPDKEWMPDDAFRRAYLDGLPYAEIAALNERLTGWPPSKTAVWRRARAMDLPARHEPRLPDELDVRPEHVDTVESHMIRAHLRTQANGGVPGSETDRVHTELLHLLLFGGRGISLIFCYHEVIGFYLVKRKPSDGNSVIRVPAVNLHD